MNPLKLNESCCSLPPPSSAVHFIFCRGTTMTKLLEWISVAVALISIWTLSLSGNLFEVSIQSRFHVFLAPLYLVIAFGVVSLVIVLYRTATFNDCPEAYQELKDQIIQARKDLESKGFNSVTSK